MPSRITKVQRQAVLEMLAQGMDRATIAYQVGVTPGQVSAVSAHGRMGTYALPSRDEADSEPMPSKSRGEEVTFTVLEAPSRTHATPSLAPVFVGTDAETQEQVFWNPDPATGAANPHVLVLGESGYGKTYAMSCLLAELSSQGVVSLIFDYGQGFSINGAPHEFVKQTAPIEIEANRDGVDINPLQIFPTDLHGPVNVAQRLADTFCRVYEKMGIQQHAVLRQAVLDAMSDDQGPA